MRDVIKVSCPKCGLSMSTATTTHEKYKEFFLYRCPKCDSNVVFYKNKADIISDKLVKELCDKKIIKG